MPEMGWALVEYPVAGLEPVELEAKAKLAYPMVVDLLTKDRTPAKPVSQFDAGEVGDQTIQLSGSTINEILEKLNAGFNKLRWSDGLPLVPPTREAVDEMLTGISLPPDEVIGLLYPNQGKATVEKIAINAVMAGGRPDYMPILVAAIKAIVTPEFEQENVLISTGSFFPVVLVNGPITKKVNINSGRGVFGPGWRANATIGRSVRLTLINIGRSWPNINDMGVMGHPGRYTCCIAENEEVSPWLSLSEEMGYPKDTSIVTVMPGLFMGYFDTTGGPKPQDILQPLCEQLYSLSTSANLYVNGETLVVLNPIHAKMLHKMGLNKQDVKEYICENTRFSSEKYLKMVELGATEDIKVRKTFSSWPDSTVPMYGSTDRIRIIVAGAEGSQGISIRGFFGKMVTCKVVT